MSNGIHIYINESCLYHEELNKQFVYLRTVFLILRFVYVLKQTNVFEIMYFVFV